MGVGSHTQSDVAKGSANAANMQMANNSRENPIKKYFFSVGTAVQMRKFVAADSSYGKSV